MIKGYVIMGGFAGCLPDFYEYAATKSEANQVRKEMHADEIDIVTLADFVEANGLDAETVSFDEAMRLLE